MTLAAAAGAAAVFSRLDGGDGGALGLAFVAAGMGQLVRAPLAGMNLPVAPVHLLCGILSACIAALGLRLGVSQTAPAAPMQGPPVRLRSQIHLPQGE